MAERASVFQRVQVGVESVAGTEVDADVRLPSISFEIGANPDIKTYRGSGFKFPRVAALHRESVDVSLSGPVTYNEIVYLLSGILDAASITDNTGTTGEATWEFSVDTTAADAPVTYTVEQGDDTDAELFTYGSVTGLTMSFTQDDVTLSGTMFGTSLQTGITMTATPSLVPVQPVMAQEVKVYRNFTLGAIGTTALTRVISAEWSLTDKYGPIWYLDGSADLAAQVELIPTHELKILMAADGAEYINTLSNGRQGNPFFMRVEAIGPIISGAITYSMQIDMVAFMTAVESFSDEDGIYAVEFTFTGAVRDASNFGLDVTVVNTQGSL